MSTEIKWSALIEELNGFSLDASTFRLHRLLGHLMLFGQFLRVSRAEMGTPTFSTTGSDNV
jgi:hypothetical protein